MSDLSLSMNQLLLKWEQHEKRIIKDGFIDEKLFGESSKKIVFLNREPNGNNREDWDFREEWQQMPKYTFGKRIAEWSYGIINNFPAYDSLRTDENNLLIALKSIALVNVKKSPGNGSMSYEVLVNASKQNKKLLHEQLSLLNPDIIILGITGDWKVVRNELFPNLQWKQSGYDIEVSRFNHMKLVDFYHPSARNAPSAAYFLLQKVIESKVFNDL